MGELQAAAYPGLVAGAAMARGGQGWVEVAKSPHRALVGGAEEAVKAEEAVMEAVPVAAGGRAASWAMEVAAVVAGPRAAVGCIRLGGMAEAVVALWAVVARALEGWVKAAGEGLARGLAAVLVVVRVVESLVEMGARWVQEAEWAVAEVAAALVALAEALVVALADVVEPTGWVVAVARGV